MKNNKIVFIEYLRILCAIAVVGIHVVMTQPNNFSIIELGKFNYSILTSFFCLLQWAVPIFLMITGALLLHSNNLTLKKVSKMIARMFIVLLLFGIFYSFLELVFEQHVINFNIIAKSILNTFEMKSWSHLWYIYTLIGIYIIIIPLKRFLDNSSSKEVYLFLLVLIFGNFIIPTINLIFEIKIYNYMMFTQYVTYLIIGYLLTTKNIVENKYDFFPNIKPTILLIIFLISSFIKILIQIITIVYFNKSSTIVMNDNLFTLIQAVVIFIIFRNVNFKNPISVLGTRISKCSFTIYLIHPFFINLSYKFFNITPTNLFGVNTILAILILWFFMFAISWLISEIIVRIPVFKNIL